MERAVAYCRVSTKGQLGDDKYGIEEQRDLIQTYCEKHDIEVVNWYIDEGISGTAQSRPAFDKILEGEVTNPPVKYVIVAKADRISRDINLYYVFKYMLSKLDLEILSVTEDWSTQDRMMGMILENFMALVGMVERENIRRRMSGGRRQKAKRGGYAGGQAPMGYKVKDGQLVINEDEAATVRYIFDLKNRGYTMQATVDELNAKGYHTRRGKPFVTSTVQSIWNNEPTYHGMYRYGRGKNNKEVEWVQGQHEPILK